LVVYVRGDQIMRRLLVAAIALLLAHPPSQAADISVLVEGTPEQPAIIFIQGQIVEHMLDSDAFGLIAARQQHGAIVFLDSPGGHIGSAMWIGRHIRANGFSTAVADHAVCTSACAIIWMAGKERYLGRRSSVVSILGFHSSRSKQTGEISQAGNKAIVEYLQHLGVTQVDSERLISAPPNSMNWVNIESLATYGITASYLRSPPQIVWPLARKRQHVDPIAVQFRG